MAKSGSLYGPAAYRIEVKGRLSRQWTDWFDGVQIESEGDITLMTANLDQSALHGLLARLWNLGLPLISVKRLES